MHSSSNEHVLCPFAEDESLDSGLESNTYVGLGTISLFDPATAVPAYVISDNKVIEPAGTVNAFGGLEFAL